MSRCRNRLALLMQHEGEEQGAGTSHRGAQQRSRVEAERTVAGTERSNWRSSGQRSEARRSGVHSSYHGLGGRCSCWERLSFVLCGLDRLLGPMQRSGRGKASRREITCFESAARPLRKDAKAFAFRTTNYFLPELDSFQDIIILLLQQHPRLLMGNTMLLNRIRPSASLTMVCLPSLLSLHPIYYDDNSQITSFPN